LLRVIGASPVYLFFLIELEALLIGVASIVLGVLLLYLGLNGVSEYLASEYGLFISTNVFTANAFGLICLVLVSSMLVSAIPSMKMYLNAKRA
jgi:putative ABC transport system permease protein